MRYIHSYTHTVSPRPPTFSSACSITRKHTPECAAPPPYVTRKHMPPIIQSCHINPAQHVCSIHRLHQPTQAPPEVLERIAGLLEGPSGSITLVERGDTHTVPRHPGFRLVAAMNPATDAGKRELPAPLRNRFTEVGAAQVVTVVGVRECWRLTVCPGGQLCATSVVEMHHICEL